MATQLKNRQLTVNLAEGQMLNGKIVPADAAGLTVALKTLAGTDATPSNPIYVMIGGSLRTVSAALSVAKADGTNWFNAGSAELATKEIDYFVYLGYNATDGVTIGFSRIVASQYSEFSVTTTNEKYCAISTITNAAATDYYNVVGRFAATLSAGASYTWSVPTFTAINLIQRPIFETRWLTWTPIITVSGGTAPTYTATFRNLYKVIFNNTHLNSFWNNTGGGTAGVGANPIAATIPFSDVNFSTQRSVLANGFYFNNSTYNVATVVGGATAANAYFYLPTTNQLLLTGAQQNDLTSRYISFIGNYQI